MSSTENTRRNHLSNKDKVREWLREIEIDTQYSSNHGDILMHPNYLKLIDMAANGCGEVVQVCIENIVLHPSWVPLQILRHVVAEPPEIHYDDRGVFSRIALNWIQWAFGKNLLRIPQTMTLFRPVGQKEMDLIAESGFRRFPPRLPEQPIFYPVTDINYAAKIARDWNTQDDENGNVGYVLRFEVDTLFLDKYEVHPAGGMEHEEYWIPAEHLEAFNDAIVGTIRCIRTYD